MILRRTLAALTVAVGCIVVITRGEGLQRPASPELSAEAERVNRLEALTQRVEAISAIKRLQHAYGHYSELGLWHDFADLFADTGIGHYTQGALDREGIRALFLKEVGQGRLGLADGRIYPHMSMQPVVTLAADGQSGKGRWHIMAMLGGYQRSASWAGGVYENEYVRENGVWKFKDVHYLPQYSGRYEDPGWTPTREPTPFHYHVSRVGKPIPDFGVRAASNVRAAFRRPDDLATLAKRMSDLATRAQALNDEIEVTNLQHAYGYYVDRKMWDDVADLFAADGTMEIGLQGVYAGQKSIRRWLNPSTTLGADAFGVGLAEGEINDHIQLQTIVSVLPDGPPTPGGFGAASTARARGTDIGMTGPPSPHGFGGASALWSQSIYENKYVKQGGVWKFKAMHVYPRFIVDAEKGWAKDAQPAPGPSRAFPPDRPATETYEVYPRFHIAPFHFAHPVTGRPPQYPASAKASAGKPVVVPSSAKASAGRPAAVKTPAALESLLTATERSVERSKAYHASENLATAYGYYIDEFAWDETADIFSRDGWKELSYVGTYVGRERIRRSLKLRYPNGKSPDFLTIHQVVQPVIHVSADARSARIRARLFQLGGPTGGEGSWISGIYENTSVDEGGTWKLSGMDLDYIWQAPSRGGWVRVKTPPTAPQVTMASEFPPDRPLRGSIAAPFPKVHAVPFHYANPVSGRVPPVLLPTAP
ncbi:MAG TPA: nuclear transport factor 2 family protein [Vicinamibacterales bacterium]|nr:nuclear transport factor 2 family protein [Vicinamibacterales bacterium]